MSIVAKLGTGTKKSVARKRRHTRVRNQGWRDEDRDGVPNRVDRDRDGDGVPNRFDSRPDNARRP